MAGPGNAGGYGAGSMPGASASRQRDHFPALQPFRGYASPAHLPPGQGLPHPMSLMRPPFGSIHGSAAHGGGLSGPDASFPSQFRWPSAHSPLVLVFVLALLLLLVLLVLLLPSSSSSSSSSPSSSSSSSSSSSFSSFSSSSSSSSLSLLAPQGTLSRQPQHSLSRRRPELCRQRQGDHCSVCVDVRWAEEEEEGRGMGAGEEEERGIVGRLGRGVDYVQQGRSSVSLPLPTGVSSGDNPPNGLGSQQAPGYVANIHLLCDLLGGPLGSTGAS
eukprot:134373-Hanusia_phi.AAC.1